jgi:hypothetical protein
VQVIGKAAFKSNKVRPVRKQRISRQKAGQCAKKATPWPIVSSLVHRDLTGECAKVPTCHDGGVKLEKSIENGRTGLTKMSAGAVGWMVGSGGCSPN